HQNYMIIIIVWCRMPDRHSSTPGGMKATPSPQRRSYWLKTLHQWHWMSAALSLAGLIVFAATGITLNNAAWVEASPTVETQTATMPPEVLALLAEQAKGADKGPLPAAAEQWLDRELGIHIRGRAAEYSPDEVYVGLPEPGADAWLVV